MQQRTFANALMQRTHTQAGERVIHPDYISQSPRVLATALVRLELNSRGATNEVISFVVEQLGLESEMADAADDIGREARKLRVKYETRVDTRRKRPAEHIIRTAPEGPTPSASEPFTSTPPAANADNE